MPNFSTAPANESADQCKYCLAITSTSTLFCGHRLCGECCQLAKDFLHRCPCCHMPICFQGTFGSQMLREPASYEEGVLREMELEALRHAPFYSEYKINGARVSHGTQPGGQRVKRMFPVQQGSTYLRHLIAPINYTRYPVFTKRKSSISHRKCIDFGDFVLMEDGMLLTDTKDVLQFNNTDSELFILSAIVRLKQDQGDYCIIDVQTNGRLSFFTICAIKNSDGVLTAELQTQDIVKYFDIAEVVYPGNELIDRMQRQANAHLEVTKTHVFKSSAVIDRYYRACDVVICLGNLAFSTSSNRIMQKLVYEYCVLLYSYNFYYVDKPRSQALNMKPVTAHNFILGADVIRGSDWTYGGQDVGGEQFIELSGRRLYIGKLVQLHFGQQIALVMWGNGILQNYRVGAGDKYDLIYCFQDVPDRVLNRKVLASPEAFARFYRRNRGACLCSVAALHQFMFSDVAIKEKASIHQEILKKGELLQYFKEQSYDYFLHQPRAKALCCLEYQNYSSFLADFFFQFLNLQRQTKKMQPTKRCSCDEIHQITEKIAHYKDLRHMVPNVNKFMLEHAGIPIHALDSRIKLPLCVTVGPDWHHGNKFFSKIGVLLPHMKSHSASQVCVAWVNSIKDRDLYEKMRQNYLKIMRTGLIEEIDRPSYSDFQVYVLDAGRQNLFEVCAYQQLVDIYNFKSGKLVAPALDWQLDTGQVLGMLLWRQGEWGLVLWIDGSVNRHKIGCQGLYELSYAEYV